MKHTLIIILFVASLLLVACQDAPPVCPTTTSAPIYLSTPPALLPTPTPAAGPFQVMMGRRQVQVDKLVEGPLCSDTWSGSVYVGCNVQVYPWQEDPTFLKDCQLVVEPNTVVYVAYHNNTAYYNGCSCHTGETPQP